MKKILSLLFLIGFFSSCDSVLEEVPQSFISRANFYKNATDAQAAVTGAYSSFYSNYGINYWLFLVNHSDYENGRGSQAPISDFSQVLDVGNVGRAASIWSSFYITINRTNSILENVPAIELDENLKNRLLAEAHFLRAMAYFNLVRGYGPVPLKTMESTDVSTIGAVRAPEDMIYDLIIQDCQTAINGLPESVGEETGRASKWAAKMLLAEVFLTRENWTGAAQEAEDIIASNQFSLVQVSEPGDFYNIFAVQTSSEDILSIHHSDSKGSSLPTYLHRPATPPYNYSSSGFYAWLPNSHEGSILNFWDENDLRSDFNLYTQYLGPDGQPVDLPASTPLLFAKFTTDPTGLSIYSAPIFRYAEAFLIAAEAESMANGGPTAEALEHLNVIKRRGYGLDPFTPSDIDYPGGMSAADFRATVLQERAYEFLLEGKRWHDLKRTGTVKEAMAKVGRTVIDERLLWPIPQEEIDNNPDLTQADQNPGY